MFDAERLLGQMMGGALGFGGRRSRTANRAALGVGLLGIAVAAYEHYSRKSAATPAAASAVPPPPPSQAPSAPPPPPPPAMAAASNGGDEAQRQADALQMLRAMIAAANADGHIDDSERASILQRARDAGFEAEDIAALEHELTTPWPVSALVTTTRPELRERVYLAARLAIDLDHPAEQAFLDELTQGLQLGSEQRTDLDARIESSDSA